MENILNIVEEISGELDSLRKFIYDNPEIGFEEYKSSKAHIDLLKSMALMWSALILDARLPLRQFTIQKNREGQFHICQNMMPYQELVTDVVTTS